MTRPQATAEKSIRALLQRARWDHLPIRRSFVQGGARRAPEPGPLARFIRRHDDRALDLYLLVRAAASGDPWDVTLHSNVWARMLYLKQGAGATSAISKTWRRLEEAQLITRVRRGPLTSVTVLREDGSGNSYTRPKTANDPYFKLPLDFWLAPEGWNRKLSLPAKAALLIALSLTDEFILPYEKAAEWYGISADTIGRGLRELRELELLAVERQLKDAPLAPEGYTLELSYTLKPPFGPLGYSRRQKDWGVAATAPSIVKQDKRSRAGRGVVRILTARTPDEVVEPQQSVASAAAAGRRKPSKSHS